MTDFRPMAISTYKPTAKFASIEEHIAVAFDDDPNHMGNLVAVVGAADDFEESVEESIAYATLFAGSPTLLAATQALIAYYGVPNIKATGPTNAMWHALHDAIRGCVEIKP